MGYFSDLQSILTSIGDSIRSKTGSTNKYKLSEMPDAINSITTCGGNKDDYGILGYNTSNGNTNNGRYLISARVSLFSTYDNSYIVGKDVESLDFAFGCRYLNDSYMTTNKIVNIDSAKNLRSAVGMFNSCYSYNNPINFPNSTNKFSMCFENCRNLNSEISFNTATSAYRMFLNCINLNSPVKCNRIINGAYMFYNCQKFNHPLDFIPDVANYMFYNCRNFNQPIKLNDAYAYYFEAMFSDCVNFNQPININVRSNNYNFYMLSMFRNCIRFNSFVNFMNSSSKTVNATFSYMFSNCIVFNKYFEIIQGAKNCYYMFNGCTAFNQNVVVPNSVYNMVGMFRNCTNFAKNIYVKNNSLGLSSVANMLYGKNNSKRVNIWCNNISAFMGTTASNSIVGAAITWSTAANYAVNIAYNIYLYNNYT